MFDIPKNKKIIIFDGICNLCNNSVLKVIKYDKKDSFIFVALQSKNGQDIINYLKIDSSKIDSIVLYEPGIAYDIKSTAVLKIMKDFGGFWFLTQIFEILPITIRDFFYDYIAKNRYKWFGKEESCMIPTPELKAKFLN
jgi:predicted DCC family thiol-disulfide oxidoreductase YuxK